MGSPSPSSPITQATQISQMDPKLYQWMYGTPNSPGRQQIANASMLAKTMQGVQNADPTALAAYYNVPKGTDLSQFQSHTGAINPGQADPSLMQFPGRSVTPQDYYKQATSNEKKGAKDPTSTALVAEGGEIRGYKKGAQLAQPTADLNDYGLTASQQRQWDKYEQQRNSGKKFTQQQIKDYNAIKDTRTQYAQANPSKPKTDLSLRDAQVGVTPFYDTETKQSTNPYYNQAVEVLRGMGNMPGQYGQASDAYSKLQNMANYKALDVTGKDAQAAGMNAASMQGREANASQMGPYDRVASRDVTGRDVSAASVNRGDIRDVAAQLAEVERYNAANIERTQREQAATTAGPKSWTDPGTAGQYMNPYVETSLRSQQNLANRQFAQQQNQLRSQAAQQHAYGGARQALAEQNAVLNQNLANQNLNAQGLNQAYQSGMGQFQAEQGLGSQVGMSNTSQINQLKQQYMSMGLSEAQANQAAINQASQFNAGSQNQAYNNYVAQQLQAQQANQMMDWNAANQNAQLAQQANLANQQYGQGGFQSQQLNQQAAMQAALANQQAGLTTEQQNAQMRQQAELANQLYGAGGFNANLQNAQFQQQANQQISQNQQQANMANQLYGVGGFNAQQANQNAGLQANQQNIGAMGQAGQGLLSVGQGIGAYNQNLLQNWGAAGNTLQNLAQGYYDKRQQSAQNIWGGVNTATQPATGTLLGSPWGSNYQGQYQQRKKGGKLSIKV